MMENDDKLLQQFFDTHRQDIADNGFSRHVIRNLPVRVNRIGRIWTALCTVACIGASRPVYAVPCLRCCVWHCGLLYL